MRGALWGGQLSLSPSHRHRSYGTDVYCFLGYWGGACPSPRPEPRALPADQLLGKSPVFLEHTLGVPGVASHDLELPDPWAGKTFHPSGSPSAQVCSPGPRTRKQLRPRGAGHLGEGDPAHYPRCRSPRHRRSRTSASWAPLWADHRGPGCTCALGGGGPVKGARSREPWGLGGRRLAGSRPLAVQVQPSASWVPGPSEERDRSAVNDRGHGRGQRG